MVVAIATQPAFRAATPKMLFEGQYTWTTPYGNLANYDIAPDDQHFVMIKSDDQAGATQLNVVLNWFEELKRRAPTK